MGVVFLELELGRTLQEEVCSQSKDGWANLCQELLGMAEPSLRQLIGRMLNNEPAMRPSLVEVANLLTFPIVPPHRPLLIDSVIKKMEDYWYLKISEEQLDKLLQRSVSSIQEEAEKGNAKAMFLLGRIHQKSEQKYR